MATLINIIGFLAAATAAAVSPLQLIALVRSDDTARSAQTVSLGTLSLICLCNTLWFVYGINHGAIWSAVLAVVAVTVQLSILAICAATKRAPLALTVGLPIAMVAAGFAATYTPAAVLGAIAATMSVANYLPATKRRLDSFRSGEYLREQTVYSTPMSITMTTTNVLWITYAVLIRDVWVGLPCVVNLAIGLAFTAMNLHRTRTLRAQSESAPVA